MNRKYRNMRIDELQRLEKELRKKFSKTKQAGIMQEIRDVEQVIRDKIWNTGGAQWKKENVK
jgi:Zn-finger domain-containing protein